MSKVKSIQLQLKTIDVQTAAGDTHKFNVVVYSINYNIFRVLAGMGGLSFQS